MTICQCIKTDGKQCSREAKTESQYCWQHQKCSQVTKKLPEIPKSTEKITSTIDKNPKPTKLINDFIEKTKKLSYTNQFYNWPLAEKYISDRLYQTYDDLSRKLKPESDELMSFSDYLWDGIISSFMGFNVGELSQEDGVLSDRLYAHTNIDIVRSDVSELLTKMYELKFQ